MKQLLLVAACLCLPTASVRAQSEPSSFQVERLDGKSLAGATLKSVSRDAIELNVAGTSTSIPLSELEVLRRSEPLPEPDTPFLPTVVLQDGSQVGGSRVKVAQRQVELTTKWGKLSFPVTEVRSLRLAQPDDKMEA